MGNDSYLWRRITVSVTVLAIHYILLASSTSPPKELILENPKRWQLYEKLVPRYLTVWNVALQMGYIVLSLYCDVSTLINKKSLVPEGLREYRYTLCTGLLLPISMSVLSFWPYYFCSRHLIFPAESEKLCSMFNVVMFHAGVVLYAVWEVVHLPRDTVKTSSKTLTHLVCFIVFYLLTLYYTKYVDLGVWSYGYLDYFEGSIMFYIALSFPVTLAFIGYYGQIYMRNALWNKMSAMQKRKLIK